jgi:hypothetical protein
MVEPDEADLARIGAVTVRAAQMEEVARGLLHWIASGNRPGTVVVSGQSHRWVLEKLERIAKRWPDEYPDLAAAVTKAKDANTKRNRLVHDALHPDVDTGKAVAVRDKDGRREQRPHLASEADQAKAALDAAYGALTRLWVTFMTGDAPDPDAEIEQRIKGDTWSSLIVYDATELEDGGD